jgi:hypothetical protein
MGEKRSSGEARWKDYWVDLDVGGKIILRRLLER